MLVCDPDDVMGLSSKLFAWCCLHFLWSRRRENSNRFAQKKKSTEVYTVGVRVLRAASIHTPVFYLFDCLYV